LKFLKAVLSERHSAAGADDQRGGLVLKRSEKTAADERRSWSQDCGGSSPEMGKGEGEEVS